MKDDELRFQLTLRAPCLLALPQLANTGETKALPKEPFRERSCHSTKCLFAEACYRCAANLAIKELVSTEMCSCTGLAQRAPLDCSWRYWLRPEAGIGPVPVR